MKTPQSKLLSCLGISYKEIKFILLSNSHVMWCCLVLSLASRSNQLTSINFRIRTTDKNNGKTILDGVMALGAQSAHTQNSLLVFGRTKFRRRSCCKKKHLDKTVL